MESPVAGRICRQNPSIKTGRGKIATTDPKVAVEVAKILYQTAVFYNSKPKECIDLPEYNSLGTFTKAHLDHCDEYYRDSTGKATSEPQNIRYVCSKIRLYEIFILSKK